MRIAKSLLQPKASRSTVAAERRAEPLTAANRILLDMHALVKAGRPEDAVKLAISSLTEGQAAPLLELARHCAKERRTGLALDLLGIVGSVRPDLLDPLPEDPGFAALRDDPRFVQMTGRL